MAVSFLSGELNLGAMPVPALSAPWDRCTSRTNLRISYCCLPFVVPRSLLAPLCLPSSDRDSHPFLASEGIPQVWTRTPGRDHTPTCTHPFSSTATCCRCPIDNWAASRRASPLQTVVDCTAGTPNKGHRPWTCPPDRGPVVNSLGYSRSGSLTLRLE